MSRGQDNTSSPSVSVLMPVFNTVSYLLDALKSISAQSFKDFEFLVIDDGSNDGSTKVLELFATQEARMKLIVRQNLGLIRTRNELLEAARGELVAWMDSDDISLPERLMLQLGAFAADPALVCLGSAAQCIDPEGQYLNLERFPSSHREILIEQQKGGAMRFPTTMMRRDVALQVGGFREPFKIGEDLDLLLRLSEVGKMANVCDTLYLYRQHISSVCAILGPQWPLYRDHILELARERKATGRDRLQFGGVLTIAATPTISKTRLEYSAYLSWAQFALVNENISLAWKYARAAIVRRPLSIDAWKIALKILLHLRAGRFAKSVIRRLALLFARRN